MYSTRNKGVAAFIIYNWGKETFDHSEVVGDQVWFYFDVEKSNEDLVLYLESFSHTTNIANSAKLHAKD